MKASCTSPVMVRLQNGYFSSASTDARNNATSWNEFPRPDILAKSQKPTPSSLTTTFNGQKSFKTPELGSIFFDFDNIPLAPEIIVFTAASSSPLPLQLLQSFSRSATSACE